MHFYNIFKCSLQEKISKGIEDLNNPINQLDLIDICIILHPTAAEYTFFSSIHGSVSGADHIPGNKISLNKFKSIEIMSSVFSDHSGIQLEVIHRK